MSIKFVLMSAVIMLGLTSQAGASDSGSTCFGETHDGHINQAVQLPVQGTNYRTFSQLAWFLGRTYVHAEVSNAILGAYQVLSVQYPHWHFMYGETGWAKGGPFKPHKTHQNGLSVDFMVPVMNAEGLSVYLPVNFSNKWGYDIEFDDLGMYQSYAIDFDAMSAHLKSLFEQAQQAGFGIKKVYFDPRLQDQLFATEQGAFLKQNIAFNKQQAWVRHDEHYHVDFDIKCE